MAHFEKTLSSVSTLSGKAVALPYTATNAHSRRKVANVKASVRVALSHSNCTRAPSNPVTVANHPSPYRVGLSITRRGHKLCGMKQRPPVRGVTELCAHKADESAHRAHTQTGSEARHLPQRRQRFQRSGRLPVHIHTRSVSKQRAAQPECQSVNRDIMTVAGRRRGCSCRYERFTTRTRSYRKSDADQPWNVCAMLGGMRGAEQCWLAASPPLPEVRGRSRVGRRRAC